VIADSAHAALVNVAGQAERSAERPVADRTIPAIAIDRAAVLGADAIERAMKAGQAVVVDIAPEN